MSDTPRTDTQATIGYAHWRDALIGMATLARTLERELAQAANRCIDLTAEKQQNAEYAENSAALLDQAQKHALKCGHDLITRNAELFELRTAAEAVAQTAETLHYDENLSWKWVRDTLRAALDKTPSQRDSAGHVSATDASGVEAPAKGPPIPPERLGQGTAPRDETLCLVVGFDSPHNAHWEVCPEAGIPDAVARMVYGSVTDALAEPEAHRLLCAELLRDGELPFEDGRVVLYKGSSRWNKRHDQDHVSKEKS